MKERSQLYKVDFEKHIREVDEVTGKKWLSDYTGITIYKRMRHRFLFWVWDSWGQIAYYTTQGLLENESKHFNTIDEVQKLLFNDLGLTENNRIAY